MDKREFFFRIFTAAISGQAGASTNTPGFINAWQIMENARQIAQTALDNVYCQLPPEGLR